MFRFDAVKNAVNASLPGSKNKALTISFGTAEDKSKRLCYRKWLMLFSLKLQRDNRKNALAVDPAKGKPEKKAVFLPHCGDETTTNYNRAKKNAACSKYG